MRVPLIIAGILALGLIALFRAADNQLAPTPTAPVTSNSRVTTPEPTPSKEIVPCFKQGLGVLRSAGSFEIEAPDWKWYGDLNQYMGSTGYVPITGTIFDSAITYQIVGQSSYCVSEAVLYATVNAPAARAAAKRKFAATMKRWFVNTKVATLTALETAVANDKNYKGTSDDVVISYTFERFPNPTIQPDGTKYHGLQMKIEFKPLQPAAANRSPVAR
jgi:hypothetical protein